jgi:hypothetical protein
MKALRPLFLVVSLMLMVGLACSIGNSSKATEEPTKAVEPTAAVDEPTAVVDEPTEVSDEPTDEVVDDPTEEPSTEAEEFYTETFDGNLDNYTYFNTGEGDEDKMSLKTNDGFLVFDLKGENLWIYVTYNPFTYKDVALEVTADNRGKNTNDISLLCRYDKEEGWYEFNVKNSGLYSILAYDATGIVKKGYNTIYNGASTAVKQGRDVNTYNVSCVGEKLSLTINGTEVKTIKDTKYRFREGKVGFSVSSYNVLPILVNVDSFTISEP